MGHGFIKRGVLHGIAIKVDLKALSGSHRVRSP